jgi:GAF domain
MATSTPSPNPYPPVRGPLASSLVTLAGTPDHTSNVGAQLVTIARLAAERVAAATYASITALRGRAYTTVALSDELVQAVDDAQYADRAGPCIEALRSGAPVAVPDIAATVEWPSFHEEAPRLGLHASVSVPLYAGSGEPIAALNLYSHDGAAMAPLSAAIVAVYGRPGKENAESDELRPLDEGGRELVLGYAEALSIRAMIKLAVAVIMTDNHCADDDAYLSLCLRAAEAGTDLAGAAAAVVAEDG